MSATVTTATTLTADTWPIGAATLMFGGTTADGRDVTTAGPGAWRGRAYARMKEVLDEVGPIPLPERSAP